ncbi:MAG TPA: hypothetical protein VIK61_01600 [Acidimicrobiia bacterium]
MDRPTRTAVALATVSMVVMGFAPALGASTAGGRAVVASASASQAPDAGCWRREYTDTRGDADPDVAAYSLTFSCATLKFWLAIAPSPGFPANATGDWLRIWISTGAAGGCNGSTRMVAGRTGPSGFVATVSATPSCDPATWTTVGSADFFELALGGDTELGFSAAAIGAPQFHWWAETPAAFSGSHVDRFPNSGTQLAIGVPYYPHATSGYVLSDSAGGVHPYGNAGFFGQLQGLGFPDVAPVVGMAPTPDAAGYWLLGRDGGVFAFGSAGFYGSTGAMHLNRPVVGMSAATSGRGYRFVASDGGVFAFGDAHFFGSTGAMSLNQPIVGMAATPSGNGYWLVASDGGVFGFGDAHFFGSTGAMKLNQPIVGMAASKTGLGYWLVASDGGVFSFGDARFFGSTGHLHLASPIIGMTRSPGGSGYRFVASDGGIFTFGDAPFFGSLAGSPTPPVVGIAG